MKLMWVSCSSSMACSLRSRLPASSDRQLLHPAPGEHQVEEPAAHEDRGEQRGEKTDEESDSEALDRAGADEQQDQRRDQGGDVRIDDGGERAVEAEVDGRAHGAAGA